MTKKIRLSSYREVAQFIPNNYTVSVEESFLKIYSFVKSSQGTKQEKRCCPKCGLAE